MYDVKVGADVTAGYDVLVDVKSGNVTVGNNGKGNVVAEHNVDMTVGTGDVTIEKSVKAKTGSVGVTVADGDITIGYNKDAETVSAYKDVKLETGSGKINIQGTTATETGDVTVHATNDKYVSGAEGRNIIFGQNGRIAAAQDATLIMTNGDLLVTNDVTAGWSLNVETRGEGSIAMATNVTVNQDMTMKTEKGNIYVGNTITANKGTVSMTAGEGDITVGEDVTAGKDVTMTVGTGNVTVGENDGTGKVKAAGDVTIAVETGNVTVKTSITSTEGSVAVGVAQGKITVGEVETANAIWAKNDIDLFVADGEITVNGKTETLDGDITVVALEKDGNDVAERNVIITQNGKLDSGRDLNIHTYNGSIDVTGDTLAKQNLTVTVDNEGDVNFKENVKVKGTVTAEVGTGDITIGKKITAGNDVNMTVKDGDIQVGEKVTADKDVNMTVGSGNILIGETVTAGGNINMTVDKGSADTDYEGIILVGEEVTAKGDISVAINTGHVLVGKKVESTQGSVDILSNKGYILIGDNGPDVKTVAAYKNVNLTAGDGAIEIYGKASTTVGDITVHAGNTEYVAGEDGQNIIFDLNGKLAAGQDASLIMTNGDLLITDRVTAGRSLYAETVGTGDIAMADDITVDETVSMKTEKGSVVVGKDIFAKNLDIQVSEEGNVLVNRDVNVAGNTTVTINGSGSVFGRDSNIVSGGTTHVALTNGDLFLNLAEGKAVVLRMENNTEASRVNTVSAEASGGAGPDVELTGNYIQIGTIRAKGGNSVLQLSAIGAGNQKLISGDFTVDHLSSANGTHMPYLWANRGYVHVDEGDLSIDDVFAKDKIHLENDMTDLAIYGRTPTRDGEQLVYWNNLGRANSKQRSFQLYANGKVRTRGAVLIDAGRHYGKLYGDNLSVVDMMRERLTNEHGQYTFDRTWFTKPGEVLREKMLFGIESVDDDIRKHNASAGQLL